MSGVRRFPPPSANSNPRGPPTSAGSARVQSTRPRGGGAGGAYHKEAKVWDGRSWPPPPYTLCDVVAEVKSVEIDLSIEGARKVHHVLTFVPPEGSGCDKTLQADYYPYSRVNLPGTSGKILREGTKVGVQYQHELFPLSGALLGSLYFY